LKHFGKGIQKKKIKIVISTREKKDRKENNKRTRDGIETPERAAGPEEAPGRRLSTPPKKEISTLKSMGKKKERKKEKKNEGGKSLNGRQIIYTCHLVVLALKEERQHAVSPVAHHVRRVIYL
jgi:hypothetical protein